MSHMLPTTIWRTISPPATPHSYLMLGGCYDNPPTARISPVFAPMSTTRIPHVCPSLCLSICLLPVICICIFRLKQRLALALGFWGVVWNCILCSLCSFIVCCYQKRWGCKWGWRSHSVVISSDCDASVASAVWHMRVLHVVLHLFCVNF